MKYIVEMVSGGMVYIPSLLTVGSGIRVKSKVFSSLRGYNGGITDERDL
jgi:hypothetical protein